MDRDDRDRSGRSQDARVESLWNSLDTQGKGQLDLEGLKRGLKKIDHPLQDADALVGDVHKAVDLNGDGRIEYNEFSQFVKRTESALLDLFRKIDRDRNGRLSKSELREAFTSAGVTVSQARLDEFFSHIDTNHDGAITFDEWRDFLLFIPANVPGLKAVFSYYTSSVKLNPEGDVHLSDEAIEGMGKSPPRFSFLALFARPPRPRPPPRPPDPAPEVSPPPPSRPSQDLDPNPPHQVKHTQVQAYVQSKEELAGAEVELSAWQRFWKPLLTAVLPTPGYFFCGGIAGIVSRTTTAPLDRLKVYLISQTNPSSKALEAAKQGSPVMVTKHAASPIIDACRELWRAGGIRSLFAGNGLNVVKVMPESAIKFGSYEASKRLLASIEGHGDPSKLHSYSQFAAGGMGGIISQFFVYPIDTLKFRMQCETVSGGLHGNALIIHTAKKMWRSSGLRPFYRGLTMGLVGMFPYSAIDLTTFEYSKRFLIRRNMRRKSLSDEADAAPGAVATAAIGGFSGALGASMVYPLNLLRTRLQTQGTAVHQRTYTGIGDVTRQTLKGEGFRGLFKGLTPNLLKVVPAVSITYVVYENSKKAMGLS